MTQANEVWQSATMAPTATIRDALKCLNDVAIKICLIASETGELIGTVSDGDIRRGLLAGLDSSSRITSLIKHDPLIVPPDLSRKIVLQLMTANKIQQIPVVDSNNKLVGLHLWDEMTAPVERSNLMVIMAGGKGTRLRPHTECCPKPMLQVAGKPILEHIIERAKLDGFSRFVLAIHYLGNVIEDYFGDGTLFGVQIEYLREESPLGTAGALSLIDPHPDLPFIVTNGDVICDISYGELLEFHIHNEAQATMAVRVYEWQHPFGVVQMSGLEITGFEEKPITRSHINAGVYALDPAALRQLSPGDHCDMPTLFERLHTERHRTVAYPMHEPWLDIGRPDDLIKASDVTDIRTG